MNYTRYIITFVILTILYYIKDFESLFLATYTKVKLVTNRKS